MKASQSTVAGTNGGGSSGSMTPGRSGLGASTGQRLPVPSRERKPALAALAVLLILGGALTSAYLVMASGQRVSAIQIAQPVAAGQRIPLGALREVQIGDTGIEFVPWSERARVATAYAAVPLVKGALLTAEMTVASDKASTGRVTVGLALKPGQLPATGLQPGTRVGLYAVGSGQGGGPRPGTLLSADAIVVSIGGGGDDRLRSDQTMVDVAVLPNEAPQLAQAASAQAVAIAVVPEGTKVTAPAARPPSPPEDTGGNTGTGDTGDTGTGNNGPGTGGAGGQSTAPGPGQQNNPAGG